MKQQNEPKHTPTLWKEIGRSKRNPTGDGRIAAIDVPELNLVAVIQTPNGGPDDECDKLRTKIVWAVNQHATLRAQNAELLEALVELVDDGECYCADYVAAHGPCGHCKARAAIARCESGVAS